jgi:serine/threonine protein kinase
MPSRQVLDVSSTLPLISPQVALPLVASPPFVGRRSTTSHKTLILSLALAGGLFAILALVLIGVILYQRLRASKTSPCDANTSVKLRKFSYRELKAATSGFSDAQKLGQGGFGSVYKGVLPDGTEVAVKRLDVSSLQGEREFQNEVSVIGRVNSPHIVNLLGFCANGKHRLLVYTFMANRSLQEVLFDEDGLGALDWDKRFKIILDTAQGLSFLHFMCDPPIIHGDVKPSNILLDSSFRARIADFGLSRLKSELHAPEGLNEEAILESIERERIRYERMARDRARRQRRRKEAEMKRVEKEEAMAISKTALAGEQQLPDTDHVAVSSHVRVSNLAADSEGMGLENVQKSANAAIESPISCEEIRLDIESENFESAEDGEDVDKSIATSKEGTPTEESRAATAFGTEEGEGEGWSTISPSQPDLDISGESSKEVPLSSATKVKEKRGRRSWSRDWWWKQESIGGELGMKDYIFDWRAGENKKVPKSKDGSLKEQQGDRNGELTHEGAQTEKQRKASCRHRSNSSEWIGNIIGELNKEDKKKVEREKSKGREWWRDEYCDELSSKCKELKKGRFSKDDNVEALGLKSHDPKERHGRNKSVGEFSGEPSQSKQQKAQWEGNRRRSRSREWWSGDFFGRGVCSTPSMRGTICYVAPEYGGGGILSEKSDVYSFGVLLLVLISGRRPLQVNVSPFTDFERANLISWTRSLAQTGNTLDLVDPALQGAFSANEANMCIIVALLCLQRLPATRPNMEEIVKILSGVAEVPALPLELSPSPPGGLSFKSRQKPTAEKLTIDAPLLP